MLPRVLAFTAMIALLGWAPLAAQEPADGASPAAEVAGAEPAPAVEAAAEYAGEDAEAAGHPAPAEAEHAAAGGDAHPEGEHAEGEHGDHHLAVGTPPKDPHAGTFNDLYSPTEFRTDLAIWSFVVFVVLLAVLWKFAWGPIARALTEREQRIAEQIASAQRVADEAKVMLAQYEAKLASAQEQVRGILEEARRDAEHTQQEIVAKAKAEAGAEVERGKREIALAESAALKSLAETSARLAIELAGKILQSELKQVDQQRLIVEALARIPAAPVGRN